MINLLKKNLNIILAVPMVGIIAVLTNPPTVPYLIICALVGALAGCLDVIREKK